MKQDRRIRKSKNAMKKTLFELMCRKKYSQITISELCELADLNRSTFYSNYTHMDDLLKEIHYDLLNAMMTHADLDTQHPDSNLLRKKIITGMIQYIQLHHHEVNVLFLNNDNHLMERNMLLFFTEKYGNASFRNLNNYPLIYHTIGFFTLVNQWVRDNYPCSAEQLAEMILYQSNAFYETSNFNKPS